MEGLTLAQRAAAEAAAGGASAAAAAAAAPAAAAHSLLHLPRPHHPPFAFRSTPQALLAIARREGWRALFAGLSINYMKVR